MDNNNEKKITLTTEDGQPLDVYVIEETKINNMNYILVTDAVEGDGDCYILKDLSRPEDAEAIYEFVEDDAEIDYLFRIFSELLDDSEVGIEK